LFEVAAVGTAPAADAAAADAAAAGAAAGVAVAAGAGLSAVAAGLCANADVPSAADSAISAQSIFLMAYVKVLCFMVPLHSRQ